MRPFPLILLSSPLTPSCPGSMVPFHTFWLPLTQSVFTHFLPPYVCFILIVCLMSALVLIPLRTGALSDCCPARPSKVATWLRSGNSVPLLDKAVVGPVLVSGVTEMNKAVLVLMELSEWQTSEQAAEKEIRNGGRTCCVLKWGSHPWMCGTRQALGN